MSCDSNSNAIARLACQVSSGITKLDSKQAFYAGLALGAASAGAGAVAVANRHNFGRAYKKLRGGSNPTATAVLPPSSSRAAAIPTRSVSGGSRSRELRPIKPIPKPEPKSIPALARASQETKLMAGNIQMRIGANGETFNSPHSYRVTRVDGSDTGLAITPGVSQGEDGPVEQPGQWGLTHTGSGALISGPYDDFSKAQQLASQLSGLRWTEANMAQSDIIRAKGIIKAFDAAPPAASQNSRPYDRGLSEKFEQGNWPVEVLQQAGGAGSHSQKFGQDDDGLDVYRLSGPRGNIHYRLKDDKIAEIVSIFPDKNVENATDGISAALQQHLAKPGLSGSKYVIVDKVTGDEYATFDPTQARQFSQALGGDGESRQLDPDAPGFDRE